MIYTSIFFYSKQQKISSNIENSFFDDYFTNIEIDDNNKIRKIMKIKWRRIEIL